MDTRTKALNRAIKVAGGRAALMQKLNLRGWDISSTAVIAGWLTSGTPAKYCPDIEAATGVKCEQLQPKPNWSFLRETTKAGAA